MSLDIVIYTKKGNSDFEVDLMSKKARQYGLKCDIKELSDEDAKFQPALPYFATDYGNYTSFESLLHGFMKKGIILKNQEK